MKEITLRITIDEANLILEALGNLPFVKVYTLIGKLQEQARQQQLGSDVPPGPAAASDTPSPSSSD